MRLAYFTNRYGAASYTFIMTEVEHLRRLGHSVDTFSVRHPGGAEAISDQVAREQASTEYFVDPRRPGLSLLKILASLPLALIRRPGRFAAALLLAQRTAAPGLRAGLRQLGYLVVACHFARRLEARGIELLHNHLGSSSATIAMLASCLSGVPYSLTIHGGRIFYEPIHWALGEKIVRSAFTACISDFCASQCMLFTPYDAWSRLNVVRCAVDDHFLDGAEAPLPEACHFVCVGRLSREKGQLLLLEAVGRLAAERGGLTLTLVGDGPLRPTLEARIAELGLHDVVRITGLLGADQVRAQLQAGRAFVLPSFSEGLPVALMEAFTQRRPVVATSVGAISELVRPGETGWLINPGSVDALVEALGELLDTSSERLTEMGRRGAALVATRHRASSEIPKLERLFRQAISGTPSRAAGA
jgi:glycosyltransferase involved in cell wall biosynthesis